MKQENAERIVREICSEAAGSDPFAAAVRATRMPIVITDPREPDNPIVYVNDAYTRLTGYTREESLGRNCRFLQGAGTNTEDVSRMREAIARAEAVEVDLLNYRQDGTTFWNRLLVSPVFDEGKLTYFFASQFEVTSERDPLRHSASDRAELEGEVRRRVRDLTESEERLRFTLMAGGLGTWTLDIASERLVASSICKANFGYLPTDTFTYENLQAAIHPEDIGRWRDTLTRSLEAGGAFDIEYRIVTPAGGIRWIEIKSRTRYDVDGHPTAMTGISADITERKEGEAHRQLLVQELGHRIRNTLATVQSIVNRTVRDAGHPGELATAINRRIGALAGAHDILTGSTLDRASVLQSVRHALLPFEGDGHRFKIAGPADLTIDGEAGTALVMALHELATNAVKYGALSNETGVVSVAWGIDGETFVLTWQERGGPPVVVPTRRGFGSQLIERALASRLSGTAEVRYPPEGVCFELRTPRTNLRDG